MIVTAKSKGQLLRKITQVSDGLKFPVLVDIKSGELRSTQANAYYWTVVVAAIQQHMTNTTKERYSKEAIHEFLKIERYGKKIIEIGDYTQEVCARSSKMTKKQFAEFVEWAEAFAVNELEVPGDYFSQGDLDLMRGY